MYKLTDEQTAILMDRIRGMAHRLKAAYGVGDADDLASCGLMGAMRGLELYDETKGKLLTYLCTRARGYIMAEIRRACSKPRSAVHLVGDWDEYGDLLGVLGAEVHDPDEFSALLFGLSQRTRDILTMHYRDGMSFAEIARYYHRSHQCIRQVHSRALRLIRQRMEDGMGRENY